MRLDFYNVFNPGKRALHKHFGGVSRCEGPAGKPHGSPLPHTDVFKHSPFS